MGEQPNQGRTGTVHRGARGLQVAHGDRALRFAPSQMIADNLSFERALESAAGSLNLGGQQLINEATLATFDAHQVIVSLQPAAAAIQLLRGKRLVPQAEVDALLVADLGRGMGEWMYHNLQSDGRMTYMHYLDQVAREKVMIDVIAFPVSLVWSHARFQLNELG